MSRTVSDRRPRTGRLGPNATLSSLCPIGLFILRGCFCLPAEPQLIYCIAGNMDDVGRPSFYHLSSTSDGNLGRLFSLKAAWQSSMGPRRNGAAMGVTVTVFPTEGGGCAVARSSSVSSRCGWKVGIPSLGGLESGRTEEFWSSGSAMLRDSFQVGDELTEYSWLRRKQAKAGSA